MEYRYTPPNAAIASSSQANVQLPIALKSTVTLTEGGGANKHLPRAVRPCGVVLTQSAGTLDLTLTSRMGIAMQSVALELYLGAGAQSANFMVSGGGSWNFDPKTLVRAYVCCM